MDKVLSFFFLNQIKDIRINPFCNVGRKISIISPSYIFNRKCTFLQAEFTSVKSSFFYTCGKKRGSNTMLIYGW